MKISRKSIKVMRNKLKVFRRLVSSGRMTPENAFQSYQSWRAHAKRCDSYDSLRTMDIRFVKLFAKELANHKLPFPCTLRAVRVERKWVYKERQLNKTQQLKQKHWREVVL